VRPGIDQLTAAGIKRDVAERWLPHVQNAMERFGIASERQVAAWLAQTAHESGGYTMLVENLNYRASVMAVCWPNRFAEKGQDGKPKRDEKGAIVPNKFALALERKPEPLANVVYSSRMGNGPVESGDGWKYRGRGLKQLTGKDNYTRCGQALGLDLVASPDLLLEPEGAALSAAWFWSVNKCGPLADADDFVGLTKKINGGTIGLADREKRYKAVLASLGH
jgi:putative chitinase